MKLAKKILACVIALALVGCFAVTAFAEGKVDVKVTAGEAIVGETVEVTVTFSNAVGLATAEAYLSFNKDVLSFDDDATTSVAGNGTFATGLKSGSDNSISIGFMHDKSVKIDAISVTFTFKVLAEGNLGLDLVDFEAGNEEEADLTGSVDVSAVKDLEAKEKAEATTPAPTTADPKATTDPKASTKEVPDTSDAGVASLSVAAGLVALAGAAFVVSKKKK